MNKIIGFLISLDEEEPNVDFFNVGINIIKVVRSGYNIYFWGIGDISNQMIDDRYSLSFPLHSNLLDRNVLIGFEGDKIVIENDWLGSTPIFYNSKEKIVSTISNFCLRDKKIHNEGFVNFCEFGYSVFEQTIFEDVKFMRHYSTLSISKNAISIEYKKSPETEESFLDEKTREDEVVGVISNYVKSLEDKIDGEIVIPTSGGFDSRLLNFLIKEKSRISSFTYGISKKQSQSSEVIYAKKIAKIFGTKWRQIKLNQLNKFIGGWFDIYGFSTHLHGMYHIEFYTKILETASAGSSLLSGIVGDIWAGSIRYETIDKYKDLNKLGHTHGLSLDTKHLQMNLDTNELKKRYFESNEPVLENNKMKAIHTVRLKMILLSYLIQLPEYFGFPVWTPFLNFEIAKATLNISEGRRKDRIWQRDFFKKVGLNVEDLNLKVSKENTLDYEVGRVFRFEPIDVELMGVYVKKTRLIDINRSLRNSTEFEGLKNKLLKIPKLRGLLRRLGFRNDYFITLNEYYVIKAIEKALKHEP